MLKIAALDESRMCLLKLEELTKQYFEKEKILYLFRMYRNEEHLLLDVDEQGSFDLFLLDTELKSGCGITVAEQIRKRDPECIIVYVTDCADYAPAAFEVDAFRYILKNELEEKLPKMYDVLCPKLQQRKDEFCVVQTDVCVEKVYYRDVLYLKKEKKYVVFYMEKGCQVRVRKTLEEIENNLDRNEFVKVDKGCIINLNHLKSVKKTECIMQDGTILGVSQPRCRHVRERVAEFWHTKL